MNACKRVLYQGRVQGVGFRYTAHGLAQRFAVTGFVRNLPDGRVELVAQGEAVEVDRYLQAVAQRMSGFIESRQEDDEPEQAFAAFEIRM